MSALLRINKTGGILEMKCIIKKFIAVILSLTVICTSAGVSYARKDVIAAGQRVSIAYMGNLSSLNPTIGKLSDSMTNAEMCFIYLDKKPVFCMALGKSLNTGNEFYTACIGNYFSSGWQKLLKGAVYYYKDSNREFTLDCTSRYKMAQAVIWRILQLKDRRKSAKYSELMNAEFENILSDICSMAEIDFCVAWAELKRVMGYVRDNEEKVLKNTTLIYNINKDNQPLLDGYVKPYEDNYAYILIEKSGEIENANVEGAVYGIYADSKCRKFITKIKTDRYGKAATTKKDEIRTDTDYYIAEKIAPAGSGIDGKVYHVKTGKKSGSTVTKKMKDMQYKIRIKTVKYDEAGTKPLSGAEFTIYR